MNTDKTYTFRFFTKEIDAEKLDLLQLYEELNSTFDDLIVPNFDKKQ